MKLSYNTNTPKSSPRKDISEHQAAFLEASSRSYKNAIIKQTVDFGFPYDISRRIERRATELADAQDIPALRLLSSTIDDFKPQVDALKAFGIKLSSTAFDISKTTKWLAGMSDASYQNGRIENVPGISNKARKLLELDDSLSSRLKASDHVYWSCRIKKRWRLLESELNFALQHKEVKTGVHWISPDAKRRYKEDHEFYKKYAKNLKLVEKHTGEELEGKKVFDPDQADYRLYANYIARAKGIAELASELGLGLSAMITITLPSSHHPMKQCEKTGKRIPNPKYTDWTIKESDKKFRHDWKKIRALLAKHKIGITHYFLAAQCHKSGVPHYHITGFFRDETHLREVLQRITQTTDQPWMIDSKNGSFESEKGITQEDPKVRGVRADIFRNKDGNPDPEGALAYMMASLKYIITTDETKAKTKGKKKKTKRSNEEVKAIKAWAKANGIRRFTTSHGHSTLWTLLRKLDDFGSVAQAAAKGKDSKDGKASYARFYKALHLIDKNGNIKKHGDEYFEFIKVQKTNDYAEQIEVIKGVNFSRVSIADMIQSAGQYILEKEWEVIRVIPTETPNPTVVTPTNKNQGSDAKASLQTQNQHPPPLDFRQYLAPI